LHSALILEAPVHFEPRSSHATRTVSSGYQWWANEPSGSFYLVPRSGPRHSLYPDFAISRLFRRRQAQRFSAEMFATINL